MISLVHIALRLLAVGALQCIAIAAHAETCTDAWNKSSAAATCRLTVVPIPESAPTQTGQAALPLQNCEIHAQCLTGTTSPANPNDLKSKEVHDRNDVNTTVYIDYVKSLKNCSGNLQLLACP